MEVATCVNVITGFLLGSEDHEIAASRDPGICREGPASWFFDIISKKISLEVQGNQIGVMDLDPVRVVTISVEQAFPV